MKKFTQLHPISKDLTIKISILKSMMYCGVLWGLYHQGWAIKSENNDFIFPFWLNSIQAHRYAKIHWPNYSPRKITPKDFEEALLPTLTRLNVTPALFNSSTRKFKLSTLQMRQFFFSSHNFVAA
ncbi:DUF2750 domain-containing protein [Acinetobacter stercoris]|uniref:DUF2750 domain-containing protein n=1 Tax=Acinetobacter stercoris TaxID=2126983 RepID=A0A2U3MZQ3_9GAMM|nr:MULTISPECIES: DUF2750 domain-containing protein [Acinetobacter]SPL70910.1 hypothetical protein KPC_2088 [Acinetobacter stercoris]